MRLLSHFFTGLLFGIGLVVSGMSNPAKVLNFLDIAGNWDPSLIFVMGGAVAVAFLGFRLVLARQAPLLAPTFQVPTRRDLDARLISGAAMFGLGWGLSGLCPGPAFTAIGALTPAILTFVVAMMAGIWIARIVRVPASQPVGT